jgi:adenylate cyclase
MDVKVLIVDDSKLVRFKVRKILESDKECRFIIHSCENGEQALRYLYEHDDLPDIIILDRDMPKMTGDEYIMRLKSNEDWRSIPVLFLTAQVEKSEVVRGLAELKADDYLAKPFDDGEMLARVKVLVRIKRAEDQSRALNKELKKANKFIRKTFGRYLSDEVVDTILASPEGLSLGGEKRVVSIMMADLRGFTALSERLEAESVVGIVNIYLEIMTEIILKYQGTIDEFIGDAILAIFGAPTQRDDDAQRAVACALEMQLAMEEVNKRNREAGYPEVAMGIGINTGSVVVGNIGSHKRSKYGVVGRNVNLTSRIESYTVGGQILISESTVKACDASLRIDSQIEVTPKGVKAPITLVEVGGIAGKFNIFMPEKKPLELIELENSLAIKFTIFAEKNVSDDLYDGKLVKLLTSVAEIEAAIAMAKHSNLKIILFDAAGKEVTSDLYAKVTEVLSPSRFRVAFTSMAPVVKGFLERSILS